jgi:hypothetical protein
LSVNDAATRASGWHIVGRGGVVGTATFVAAHWAISGRLVHECAINVFSIA